MDQYNDPNPYAGPSSSGVTEAKTSGMAISSLVLGVLGFACTILTGLPAIILGIIALGQIKRSEGQLTGSGLAIGGIITGSIATAMLCLIGPMIALLLPAVQAAREAARAAQSTNNMKQINLALLNYESQHGTMPVIGADAAGNQPNLSWRVHLLPYLEGGDALYQMFHLDEPWDSDHNIALLPLMPEVYQNPNDLEEGKTNYLAVVGPGAAFRGEDPGPRFGDFTDGVQTIWLVEANEDRAVEWTKPDDWQFDPNDPWQGLGEYRPSGQLVGRIDGSASRLDPYQVDDAQLRREMTRDAGD